MDSNRGGLRDQIRQSWRALGVDQSPFLGDLTPADRSWWRVLLGLIAGAVGGLVIVIILLIVIAIPVIFIVAAQGTDPARIQTFFADIQKVDFKPTYWVALALIWALALTNGAMMLGFVWIGSLLNHKPLRLSFTAAPHWRWRQLVGGLVFYGAVLGLMQAIEVAFTGQKLALPVFSISHSPALTILFVILSVPGWILAAGVEELAFRGWILRHSAALMRWAWLYILVNGLLFSIIHWDFQPEHFDLNAFIARAVMGWGFSYMTLRMGGIELSTGAHAANNLLIVMFTEPFNLGTPPAEPFTLGPLAEAAFMLVLLVGVTEAAIRVPALARFFGPPARRPSGEEAAFS